MKRKPYTTIDDIVVTEDYVRRICRIDSETGCWEYPRIDNCIYLKIEKNGKTKYISVNAAKYLYEMRHGVTKKRLYSCCGNPKCCNPSHMIVSSNVCGDLEYGENGPTRKEILLLCLSRISSSYLEQRYKLSYAGINRRKREVLLELLNEEREREVLSELLTVERENDGNEESNQT